MEASFDAVGSCVVHVDEVKCQSFGEDKITATFIMQNGINGFYIFINTVFIHLKY